MSYAPPGESNSDLWIERSNLDGFAASGVMYGILFVLFVNSMQLAFRATIRSRWLELYSVILFATATIGYATNAKFVQMTFIDDRNYPGGPNGFTVGQYANWINMLGFASYVVMNWLADGLVLYRFMVIYNFNLWLLPLPGLMFLGSIAMSTSLLVTTTRPGLGFWSHPAEKFSIAFWSLSISLNSLLSICIVGRLIYYRARLMKIMARRTDLVLPYVSIIAMVVESASLYSVCGLIFVISYARGSSFQNIALPVLGQVQGIAPLLIFLRVWKGRAWTTELSRTPNLITNIEFSERNPAGSSCNSVISKTQVISNDVA